MKALSIALLVVLLLAMPVVADDEPAQGDDSQSSKDAEKQDKKEAKQEEKEAKSEEKSAGEDESPEAEESSSEQARSEGGQAQESGAGNALLLQSCKLIANHIGDPTVPKTQWIIIDPQGCVRDTVRKIIERPIPGLGR